MDTFKTSFSCLPWRGVHHVDSLVTNEKVNKMVNVQCATIELWMRSGGC